MPFNRDQSVIVIGKSYFTLSIAPKPEVHGRVGGAALFRTLIPRAVLSLLPLSSKYHLHVRQPVLHAQAGLDSQRPAGERTSGGGLARVHRTLYVHACFDLQSLHLLSRDACGAKQLINSGKSFG